MTDPRYAGRHDASITDAVPVGTARPQLPVDTGGRYRPLAGAG